MKELDELIYSVENNFEKVAAELDAFANAGENIELASLLESSSQKYKYMRELINGYKVHYMYRILKAAVKDSKEDALFADIVIVGIYQPISLKRISDPKITTEIAATIKSKINF